MKGGICTIHHQPACLDCAAECSNAIADLSRLRLLVKDLVEAAEKVERIRLCAKDHEMMLSPNAFALKDLSAALHRAKEEMKCP